MTEPMWTPTPAQVEKSNMVRFMRQVEAIHGVTITDYADLHRWSVEHIAQFWSLVWDSAPVIASQKGECIVSDVERMPGARWFPQARLNFAENLLRRRDNAEALVFRGEDQVRRTMTFAQLYDAVAKLAAALRAAGVEEGDRVAGYLPNMPEAVIAMLATASIGAVWSSCSPDFGVRGVVDRFGQIEPKVLFSADGYFYNGKRHDSIARLVEIRAAIPSLEHVVVVPYTSDKPDLAPLPGATTLADFTADSIQTEVSFTQLPFDHPLYIMYSSGTTGVPKCIVHGAGGTLLKHFTEQQLHTDLRPGDRICFFTTCGWMMWNWLISALASEATVLLYDGSPFYPNGGALFDFADETGAHIVGTSAKFIDAVKKSGLRPRDSHDLSSVRTLLSTGSPLAPESFDFVYDGIKTDVCLSSITGGTDIMGCFALGNPILPVHRGEIQSPALGLCVEAFDDDGNSVIEHKGELVCTTAFPSMPIGFWNDDDGSRYHAAYFDKFKNTWCHGDYVERTRHDGLIVFGRSDAVLNPGGVRIGTAEIYRQVEQLDEVVESLVIGQRWDADVRIVLFVVLRAGLSLDDGLREKIRQQIRANATPRHVPAKFVQVTDIPRTKSGKIVELAVRSLVHGEAIKNREALANPEALDQFIDIADLQTA